MVPVTSFCIVIGLVSDKYPSRVNDGDWGLIISELSEDY